MFDTERLIAFIVVTATMSFIPGPSMLFVMTQSIWRGARSGWAALMGMQLGYVVWWMLAALGLGTLAATFPLAFTMIAVAGALYLAWLGIQAIRHASHHTAADAAVPVRAPSRNAFRDGAMVAIGNPKSLIYIVAILPPFIDPGVAIAPQLVLLALVAMAIDIGLGAVYIFAGSGLARAMERPTNRKWLDRAVGIIFLAIAVAVLFEILAEKAT